MRYSSLKVGVVLLARQVDDAYVLTREGWLDLESGALYPFVDGTFEVDDDVWEVLEAT